MSLTEVSGCDTFADDKLQDNEPVKLAQESGEQDELADDIDKLVEENDTKILSVNNELLLSKEEDIQASILSDDAFEASVEKDVNVEQVMDLQVAEDSNDLNSSSHSNVVDVNGVALEEDDADENAHKIDADDDMIKAHSLEDTEMVEKPEDNGNMFDGNEALINDVTDSTMMTEEKGMKHIDEDDDNRDLKKNLSQDLHTLESKNNDHEPENTGTLQRESESGDHTEQNKSVLLRENDDEAALIDTISDNSRNLKMMIAEAIDERQQLTSINADMHEKVLVLWKKYGKPQSTIPDDGGISPQMQDSQEQYARKVTHVSDQHSAFRAKQETLNARIVRLNARLMDEDKSAADLRESFRAFRHEIIKSASFSRSGKPITDKRISMLEVMDEQRDRELEVVRLKHIHFRAQLKKLELRVREKEQLSEGLHLIDFEQLKIENQTLNEKIEERNDELHKLRKKVTTTVQILTHIKEKLQFVEQHNGVLQNSLQTVEASMKVLRDRLTKAKRSRDRIRNENAMLKQKQGFVGSDRLVVDFENRKNEISGLEKSIVSAQQRYALLVSRIDEVKHFEKSQQISTQKHFQRR